MRSARSVPGTATTYVMAVLDTATHDGPHAPASKTMRRLARSHCVWRRVERRVKHGHDVVKGKSGEPDTDGSSPRMTGWERPSFKLTHYPGIRDVGGGLARTGCAGSLWP